MATTVTMEVDEQYPIYGSVTVVAGGSFQIQSANWSLSNDTGTIIQSNVSISSDCFDSGPQNIEAKAWVNFSPVVFASSSTGQYLLKFSITGIGTDGLIRKYEPSIAITVVPVGYTSVFSLSMKDSEKFPIFGTVTIPSGLTFTVSNCTWDLLDGNGNVVSANNNTPGLQSGARPTSTSVWADFSPADLSLAEDLYTFSYIVTGISSDTPTLTRKYRINVSISVVADQA